MKRIDDWKLLACDPNNKIAATAMVKLSRCFGRGKGGVEPNQALALQWAEEAAKLDSPDGYLEIARIVGSGCMSTPQPELKKEYASYVIGTCDLQTLERFGRPSLPNCVGYLCAYMIGAMKDTREPAALPYYQTTGKAYYTLAYALTARNEKAFPLQRRLAEEGLAMLGYPVQGPERSLRTEADFSSLMTPKP